MLRASLFRHPGKVLVRTPHASSLSSYSYFRNPPKHGGSVVGKGNKQSLLYQRDHEKDSCGVGILAQLQKKPSRKVVLQANEMLVRMSHRGGCGCDPASGDGAGMLVGMPHMFIQRLVDEGAFGGAHTSVALVPEQYAVGNVFFSKNSEHIDASKKVFDTIAKDLNLTVLGWRPVPTSNHELGQTSLASEPHIEQVLVLPPSNLSNDHFEKELMRFVTRAFPPYVLSRNLAFLHMTALHSMHGITAHDFSSHLALVHSRFSTNTFPSWDRAQPYRVLCHNGEINTLRGNKNWMFARGSKAHSAYFGHATSSLLPVCSDDMSDSGT
ncbi:hypothetical protein DYB35_009520 [Aphanomyces astaci]|uniref:glutamate synthase (ferredoxin) n=1 Tax=Aphanomyces astaci TaxID=112090 RepID=A0A3R7AU31_APHAT|nr:hypothetical protein DYB35_009520 [Aphanomyces astaci]